MQGRGGIFLPSPVFYSPGHLCCSYPHALDDEIMKTGFYIVCGLIVSQTILPVLADESQYYSSGLIRTKFEGKHGTSGLWQCFPDKPVLVKMPKNLPWYKDLASEIEKNCPAPITPGASYILTFKDGKIGELTSIATSGSTELDAMGADAIRKSMPFSGMPVDKKPHLYRVLVQIRGKKIIVKHFPPEGD